MNQIRDYTNDVEGVQEMRRETNNQDANVLKPVRQVWCNKFVKLVVTEKGQ